MCYISICNISINKIGTLNSYVKTMTIKIKKSKQKSQGLPWNVVDTPQDTSLEKFLSQQV